LRNSDVLAVARNRNPRIQDATLRSYRARSQIGLRALLFLARANSVPKGSGMIETIPALSIRQPHAHAILHFGKDIENRVWATKYRGPLLIHAGKACNAKDFADVMGWMRGMGCELPDRSLLPRGGIVGIVDVVDCVEESTSRWFGGPFGFVLANPRPLPFLPYKGQLSMFRVPATMISR
jgi:hypothetical protein